MGRFVTFGEVMFRFNKYFGLKKLEKPHFMVQIIYLS